MKRTFQILTTPDPQIVCDNIENCEKEEDVWFCEAQIDSLIKMCRKLFEDSKDELKIMNDAIFELRMKLVKKSIEICEKW